MISHLKHTYLGGLFVVYGLTVGAFSQLDSDDYESYTEIENQSVTIEDFSQDRPGHPPSRWRFITSSREVWPLSRVLDDTRTATVRSEGGDNYLRLETDNRALRITLRNEVDFDWSLDRHSDLQWDWRAPKLPEGGREDRSSHNSVAAAVYVTFGTDWLGRPRSIKYTYSSTLSVGTVISHGPLRVMVVSSGADGRNNQWSTMRRDIPADYRQLFGSDPPNDPISITVWSDSDSVPSGSIGDFNNFILRPSRR